MRSLYALAALALIGCSGDDVVMGSVSSLPDAAIIDASLVDATIIVDAGNYLESSTTHLDAGLWDGNFDYNNPVGGNIIYQGGNIMHNPINAYAIWYGNWNVDTMYILEDLLSNMSSSQYFGITKSYYQTTIVDASTDANADAASVDGGDKIYVSNSIVLAKVFHTGYTQGKSLIDPDIVTIVTQTLSDNNLAPDPDGVYFVFTSADVIEGNVFSGFCTDYCGWHDEFTLNNIRVKYAFIGDTEQCPTPCSVRDQYNAAGLATSPNGNWSADEVASIVSHELSEMLTDPGPNSTIDKGWIDGNGYENADKCAWNYGQLYVTNNNSIANVRIGQRDFLIQRNWSITLDGGQGCALQ